MAMLGITCPQCHAFFAASDGSLDDDDDDDGPLVSCPHCLREFDPWKQGNAAAGASEAEGVDALVNVEGDLEDEELHGDE